MAFAFSVRGTRPARNARGAAEAGAVVSSKRRNWFVRARLRLFMLMFRNSVRAVDLFNLPSETYVEVGRQIEI
jgi:K+ transporter